MTNKMVNAAKVQLKKISLIACVFIAPVLGYAQGLPNGNGSSPFGPAVPFDNKMDLVFLAAGLLFAVIAFMRMQKNRAAKKQVADQAAQ
jgi:hypothetical protein